VADEEQQAKERAAEGKQLERKAAVEKERQARVKAAQDEREREEANRMAQLERKAVADEEQQAKERAAEEKQLERKAAVEKAPWRVWTDASRSHTVEAQFKGLVGGQVKLLKKDGTEISIPLEWLSEEGKGWIKELSLAPPEEEKDEEKKTEKPAKTEKLEDSPVVGIWVVPNRDEKLKFYRNGKVQGESGGNRLLQGKWSVLNKKKGRYTIVWAHVLPQERVGSRHAGVYHKRYALVLLNGDVELLYGEGVVPFTASSEAITGLFEHYKRTSDDPDVEPRVK
jgi:hypothetical protein